MQLYAADRLVVSSSGSANVSSLLTETNNGFTYKLILFCRYALPTTLDALR